MKLKELLAKLRKALLDARAITEAAEKDNRDFTAEERQKITGYLNEAADLKKQIKACEDDEALRKQIQDLGAGMDLIAVTADGHGRKGTAPDGQGVGLPAGMGASIGEQFVTSEAYRAWYKNVAPTGYIPENTKGFLSPPVEFRSLLGRKTVLTGGSDTSGGAFVQTDYTGIYEPLGRRPLTLRDIVSKRTTTGDLVEYVRQTAKVTQAAPVAEANVTTYSGATGEISGEKPEATMAFEKVTSAVKTIAVWIPATKRALSDVGQLRGIIDQELRDDLEEDLEDEMTGGDGTGEHFTGILHTSGVLTQAWDTDLLTTARKAITYLRTTGRTRATAWLVHPNDAETIDLLKDLEGRYYYGGPGQGGVAQLWRVPVVECEAIDEGQGVLGDFRKAVLWDREQSTIQVSDSHSDFFIRNLVAVLAEMRAAFGLIRPSAFCKVEFSSGS